MKKSETIAELAKALATAQGKFDRVIKGRKVDFTTRSGQKIKYNYAELSDVLEATQQARTENGLSVTQLVRQEGDKSILETVLLHSSGEWLQSDMVLDPQDKGPQAEGSAITYARRYSLSAILGIASEEDDDGEAAMPRGDHKQQPAQHTQQPTHPPKPADSVTKQAVDAAIKGYFGTEAPAPHWCKEHNTAYFKKGNMKGFAHPIEGTKAWCNEDLAPEPVKDEVDSLFDEPVSHHEAPVAPSAAPVAPTGTDPVKLSDLMPWVYRQYGKGPTDVCKLVGVKHPSEIKDIPGAVESIKANWTSVMAGAK